MNRFDIQIQNMTNATLQDAVETVADAARILTEWTVDGGDGLPGTPVDSQQARSNWFLEVDSCSGRTSADTSKANLSQADAVVAGVKTSRKVPKYFSLFNNLPYIAHLEYGLYPNPPKNPTGKTINGFSTQAPQGFFRLAIQQFPNAIRKAQAARSRRP